MTVNVLTKESLFEVKHAMLNAIRESMEKRPEEPKKWLLTSEVKYLLQISASTLQTLRIDGTLKYSKTCGIIYYDYEHIKKLLEQGANQIFFNHKSKYQNGGIKKNV